jgi:hypothetical protein
VGAAPAALTLDRERDENGLVALTSCPLSHEGRGTNYNYGNGLARQPRRGEACLARGVGMRG